MNRKTAIALALASAFALSTFSTYAAYTVVAQEAPKPESPDQETPAPKPESPDLFA